MLLSGVGSGMRATPAQIHRKYGSCLPCGDLLSDRNIESLLSFERSVLCGASALFSNMERF